MTEAEPNAALIMMLRGEVKDKSTEAIAERNSVLQGLAAINEGRERELRRLDGLEKARKNRKGKT